MVSEYNELRDNLSGYIIGANLQLEAAFKLKDYERLKLSVKQLRAAEAEIRFLIDAYETDLVGKVSPRTIKTLILYFDSTNLFDIINFLGDYRKVEVPPILGLGKRKMAEVWEIVKNLRMFNGCKHPSRYM